MFLVAGFELLICRLALIVLFHLMFRANFSSLIYFFLPRRYCTFRASYCSGFLVDALRFGSLSFQLFTTSLTFLTALLYELGLSYVLLSEGL